MSPRDVAITRDDTHVYVASAGDPNGGLAATVLHFERHRDAGEATGGGDSSAAVGLSWRGPTDLAGATSLALSEDDATLFAAGPAGLVAAARGTDGSLSVIAWSQVAADDVAAASGALVTVGGGALASYDPDAPDVPLDRVDNALLQGAAAVALGPDGARAYVAGAASDVVTAWSIGDGSLALAGTLEGHPGLDHPADLLVSPSGRLYVAGFCDHDVAWADAQTLQWQGSLWFDQPAGGGACLPASAFGFDAGPDPDPATYRLDHPSALVWTPQNRLGVAGKSVAYDILFYDETDDGLRAVSFLNQGPRHHDYADQEFHLQPSGRPDRFRTRPLDFDDTVSAAAGGSLSVFAARLNNSFATVSDVDAEAFVQRGDGGITTISGAYNLALSPDGRHAYVAARMHGAVGAFAIGPGGALEQRASDGVPGEIVSEGGITNVSVSPDGAHVVSVESTDPRVHVHTRDPQTGDLTWLEAPSVPACDQSSLPVTVLVAPEGDAVYVGDFASYERGCLSEWTRGPDGHLTFRTMHEDAFLAGIESLAISGDASDLYAACLGGTVAHYRRGPQGALSAMAPVASSDLEGAEFVALSPDDRFVFVSSPLTDRLLVYDRADDGTLTLAQRLTTEDAPIDGAAGIAPTPDGRFVYLAARVSETITAWSVGADGRLSLAHTLDQGDGVRWVNGLRVTPDSGLLVAAAVRTSAISTYRIAGGKKDPTGAGVEDGCGGVCP